MLVLDVLNCSYVHDILLISIIQMFILWDKEAYLTGSKAA